MYTPKPRLISSVNTTNVHFFLDIEKVPFSSLIDFQKPIDHISFD